MYKRAVVTFVILLFSCFCVSVWAKSEKVPCDKFNKLPLIYGDYGIETPRKETGWKCFVDYSQETSLLTISWEKGNKLMGFEEEIYQKKEKPKDAIDHKLKAFANTLEELMFDDPKQAENPMWKVRVYFESFLADEKFASKNSLRKSWVDRYSKSSSKSIIFGKNNEKIVVYVNDGIQPVEGKEFSYQTAEIFKKSNVEKKLQVAAKNCTPDEFFSLIINPVIQK